MQSLQCQVWSLERYARLGGNDKSSGTTDWEYFDNQDSQLELTIVTTDQMLIHQGRKQLESIPLCDARDAMKGVSKGDSLMIIWKINNLSRRFRMKFSATGNQSGDVRCRQCVESLVKYFPVKMPGQPGGTGLEHSQVSGTPGGTGTSAGQQLTGDVTLGQIAEVTLKSTSACLPSVYNSLSGHPSVDLNTMIKLCLTDPTFPAFVGHVETELEKIKAESSQ